MMSPNRTFVLLSGICALVLTMGVARFAYTPMLAYMQAQTGLSDALAGWLAGWNYLGYLTGVLVVTRMKDLMRKDRLYRISLLLAVATTAMMPLTEFMPMIPRLEEAWIWGLSRYLAGVSTAGGLMLGSGLILNWLIRHGHRSELGLHFSGLGLGIVLGGLLVELAAPYTDWRGQWWLLTGVGLLLLIPAWYGLPRPNQGVPLSAHSREAASEPGPLWLWLLQAAYLCAGFGYTINATFTVLITEQQPALSGQGGLMWLLVGLAAAPAPVLWDRIARRLGYLRSLQTAYLLQIIGILLPVFSASLAAAIASSLLFGLTFIGIVSLVLTMVGVRYPAHPAQIMARLTVGYGIAQIIAPVVAGELAELRGTFDDSLIMVGVIMVLGLLCLLAMERVATNAEKR
ncbi:YbfB/YjiJ family MFS transporter [Halochromatium salexigens]|uniref:MFS transporter n=1 Tax=Halochromatium salexigens TaxID=49447 RepID=A0AAJ0UHE1_HALSE|nr:YbfB/YjiJ family MFS transporter [Halochromatium salexigens]MBK5931541.1 MFS transporter [Halochromatium salexigens]